MQKIIRFAFVTMVVILQWEQAVSANEKGANCLTKSCQLYGSLCDNICKLGRFKSGKCNNENNTLQCQCEGNGNVGTILGAGCNLACTPICVSCGLSLTTGKCSAVQNSKNSVRCECKRGIF